jgi:hypothetical protein
MTSVRARLLPWRSGRDAGNFSRMSDDKLREFIAEEDRILVSLSGKAKTKH